MPGKKEKISYILILILSALYRSTIGINPLFAEELREYEPVCITADHFPAFSGADVSDIFACHYSQKTNTWSQIPFQIDEKGLEIVMNFYDSTRIDTFYSYFGAINQLLEPEEEILFMFRDAGDKAPDSRWISDSASRDFPRYEIQVKDPLNPFKTRYVYLYRSSAFIPDSNLADYVQLIPASSPTRADDAIQSPGYFEGHDSSGFTVDWQIPESHQGTNIDIMDMLKMRLKVNYFGFLIKIMANNALEFRRLDYVDGPIRVIRRLNYFLMFAIITKPIGIADFTTYYYPYHTDVRGPTRKLDESWGVYYIRQSFDLNQNAIGMRFHNPQNSNILIDGQPDESVVKTLLPSPAQNWHLITGSPGSILFTYVAPPLGTGQELYYFDNKNEPSGDDFPRDSGDGQSYGDVGIAISGERMAGSFGMSYEALFLGAEQDPAIGPEYLTLKENPVQTRITEILYDRTPPGNISDLSVLDYTLNSITLAWTAPGDDGQTGNPITKYELVYSQLPVDGDFDEWLMFATRPKAQPFPQNPGTIQHFTVKSLNPHQHYYFVLRSQDDMGYWSEYSNIANGISLPVEFNLFEAIQEGHQIKLHWQTVSEKNNHGFEIQKRETKNKSAGWQKIGFVKGQGTISVPQNYTFYDLSINPGTFAYRLKQIDHDGQFSFSGVRQITIAAPKQFVLNQNYPNPFNPMTAIGFEIPEQAENHNLSATIYIYNTLGDQVRSFKLNNPSPGQHQVVWDATNEQGQKLAAGIYFYRFVSKEFTQTRKMLLLP